MKTVVFCEDIIRQILVLMSKSELVPDSEYKEGYLAACNDMLRLSQSMKFGKPD